MLSNTSPPEGPETVPKKLPLKRSLFSKPSWSKPQNLDSSDLFHRSDQTYANTAAELERERKRRLARREKERLRQEESEERAAKRRCVSEDEDDDNDDENDDDDDSNDHSTDDQSSDRSSDVKTSQSHVRKDLKQYKALASPPPPVKSLGDNYQSQIAEKAPQGDEDRTRVPAVIDLGDGDSSEGPPDIELKTDVEVLEAKKAPEPEEDDLTASDEEFPELARQAREKARRKRLEEDVASLPPALASPGNHPRSFISQATSPPPPPEPVLQILITSSIANTRPLIVSRKLGQRLKDVRLAWAQRQEFSSDFTDNVFLTWRGKRLFDVTTCKSLGVTVDLDGRILAKGDVLGDEEGRIHMEAMTTEILTAKKRAKSEDVMKAEREGVDVETQETLEGKPDNQVRIILKAKGFEEFKLRVKPTTLVSKIVHAFKHGNGLDQGKEVFVMFEGGRLEPGSTVEDAEIADMDSLDTYVK